MSTLVGHFVSSPREREKRDRRNSRGDKEKDREERGTGMKVKKQKKKLDKVPSGAYIPPTSATATF